MFSLPAILAAEHRHQYFVAVLLEHCLWSVAAVVVDAAVAVAVDDVAADLFDAGAVAIAVGAVDAAAVAADVRMMAVLMLRDVRSLDVRALGAVHVEVVASIGFGMLVLPF